MASSYAGVTFEIPASADTHPFWQRERRIQRTPVPGGSVEYLVDTGSSNLKVTYRVTVRGANALADFSTLLASVGITKRTLVLFDETIGSVMMTQAAGATKRDFGSWYEADFTFEREA